MINVIKMIPSRMHATTSGTRYCVDVHVSITSAGTIDDVCSSDLFAAIASAQNHSIASDIVNKVNSRAVQIELFTVRVL